MYTLAFFVWKIKILLLQVSSNLNEIHEDTVLTKVGDL